MESLWCMHRYRRKTRGGKLPYTPLVHLHFFPYNGFTYYHLYGISLLDEHEAVYADEP